MTNQEPYILLVDDDEVDTLRLQRAFCVRGVRHPIITASTGVEALARLEEQGRPPAFVLLDLNMPEMDGFELLAELRDQAIRKSVPVVVLTTSADPRDIRRSYELGVAGYFVKPITGEEFMGVVDVIWAYWRASARPDSLELH